MMETLEVKIDGKAVTMRMPRLDEILNYKKKLMELQLDSLYGVCTIDDLDALKGKLDESQAQELFNIVFAETLDKFSGVKTILEW